MSKQIRNLGVFLTLCYMALFVQVNRITVFQAEDLQTKPGNDREARRDFDTPRGTISTADGVVLAQSVEVEDPGARFKLQRTYPQGDTYGHITGFFNPLSIGSAGLERQYNDELAGRELGLTIDRVNDYFEDFFVEKDRVGNLTLTIRDDAQQAARQALGDQKGSVVALDPRSGAILAMWSFPSYDPNVLATHDFDQAQAVSQALTDDPNNPRLARTYQEIFPPGSTFKAVTASAGVDSNSVTPEEPDYPVTTEYTPPGTTRPIRNFGGSNCGGTLFVILQNSCNTSFAEMGAETIGSEEMIRVAQGYGFNQEVPIDLPDPAQSAFPLNEAEDTAARAQMSIGQRGVASTPLQMAMVAGGVANGGSIMRPHVLAEIRDQDENVVRTTDAEEWTTPIAPATAGVLREAMRSVVTDGTAQRLDDGLEDFVVGGKTGTAQIGGTGRSHAWIIGFAGPEGEDAQVAVAVIVEGQEGNSEQTGGQVAAPIAAQVMATALTPLAQPEQEGEGGG
jgi:peptidoglycan glycosyltransferase